MENFMLLINENPECESVSGRDIPRWQDIGISRYPRYVEQIMDRC